jgi:hypothetical protein
MQLSELDRRLTGPNLQNANIDQSKASSERLFQRAINGGGYAGRNLASWTKNKRPDGTKDAKRPYRPSTAGLSRCLGLSGRSFGLGKPRFLKSVQVK